MGQKADDTRTIPLCRRCHDDAQTYRGRFGDWTKHEMRAWFEGELAKVMALKAAQEGYSVKQRIRIKLDFVIEHETNEPGVTDALQAFPFAEMISGTLMGHGVIQGPVTVAAGAYREILTEQDAAA